MCTQTYMAEATRRVRQLWIAVKLITYTLWARWYAEGLAVVRRAVSSVVRVTGVG